LYERRPDRLPGLGDLQFLKHGTSGDEEVRRVAARPVVGQRSGEIMVYYAITDMCPAQMSKRKDEWHN
jgi:hypothetical protein